MAPRKNMGRISFYSKQDSTVLDMGDIEIWDGADLSLIRDALAHVIEKKKQKHIAIEMKYVKYVPSGFFGMLYDWFEHGIKIALISPQDHVQEMLWFKRFFIEGESNWYDLYAGPDSPFIPEDDEESEVESTLVDNSKLSDLHLLTRHLT